MQTEKYYTFNPPNPPLPNRIAFEAAVQEAAKQKAAGQLRSEAFPRHCEDQRDEAIQLGLAVPGKHLPQGHGASVAPWYKPIVCLVKDSLTVPLGKCFPSLSLNLDAANRKSLAAWLPSCPAAFSLVEMLMALLVASLLLAALAPVITKKAGLESVRVSGSNHSINPILDEEGFECFTQSGTVERKNKVPGVLHVIMVSGGGGGGSASQGSASSGSLEKAGSGTSLQTSTKMNITKNMINVNVTNLIGGGAGGGGAAGYGTSGYSSEEKDDTITTSLKNSGSECPSGSKWDKNKVNCVTTSNLAATWANANSACNGMKYQGKTGYWRLPNSKSEITSNWDNTSPGGLITNGGYWCNEFKSADHCSNSSAHYNPRWYGSSWGAGADCDTANFYYRCVLPGSTEVTTGGKVTYYYTTVSLSSFSAAGGGAAPAITNLQTQNITAYNELQNAISQNEGGQIYITAGYGGAAGNSRTAYTTRGNVSDTSNGSNGAESCVIVTKADKATVAYKVCARGGLAGNNRVPSTADNTVAQANAAYTANGCYYKVGTDAAVNFNCSGGSAGSNGENKNLQTFTNTNTSGYNYPAASRVSTGGNGGGGISVGGTIYGAGGKGAGITVKSAGGSAANISTSVTAAVAGGVGYGKVTYGLQYSGNPGAGGSGGSLTVEHINTRGSNIDFELTIGKGGQGGQGGLAVSGTNGNPGGDGGNTTFKVYDNTNKMEVANYTVYGGKGGGGGVNDGAAATASNPNAGKGGAQNATGGLNLSSGSKFTTKNGGTILGAAGADANIAAQTGGDGGTSGISAGLPSASTLSYKGGTVDSVNGSGWDTSAALGVPIGGVTLDMLRGASRDKFPSKGGWGGAGGAFKVGSNNSGVGAGGNGMPGYVCVYWLNGQWE